MKKSVIKSVILVWLVLVGTIIFVGCDKKTNNQGLNEQSMEELNTIVHSIYKNLYIGEIFTSGYAYIEPFSRDRSINNEAIELNNYPQTITIYPIEESQTNINYQGIFDKKFNNYVPKDEESSKYFVQAFSKPKQFGLCYKLNSVPTETKIGVAFLKEYLVTNNDSSVNGNKRTYTETEYKEALNEVNKDNETNEDRTLSNIDLDNTIIGAKQMCKLRIEEFEIDLLISKYNTHGVEYAADVYVIDFIKDGKIIKTYQKYNWDGPY